MIEASMPAMKADEAMNDSLEGFLIDGRTSSVESGAAGAPRHRRALSPVETNPSAPRRPRSPARHAAGAASTIAHDDDGRVVVTDARGDPTRSRSGKRRRLARAVRKARVEAASPCATMAVRRASARSQQRRRFAGSSRKRRYSRSRDCSRSASARAVDAAALWRTSAFAIAAPLTSWAAASSSLPAAAARRRRNDGTCSVRCPVVVLFFEASAVATSSSTMQRRPSATSGAGGAPKNELHEAETDAAHDSK
mmetsp:Transcript_25011/g.99410  ORF Transcript_25011/g.99410 Transcript_25011/m.99410 type:complete len:252 (-) Transcript_25011:663-1418(-)